MNEKTYTPGKGERIYRIRDYTVIRDDCVSGCHVATAATVTVVGSSPPLHHHHTRSPSRSVDCRNTPQAYRTHTHTHAHTDAYNARKSARARRTVTRSGRAVPLAGRPCHTPPCQPPTADAPPTGTATILHPQTTMTCRHEYIIHYIYI